MRMLMLVVMLLSLVGPLSSSPGALPLERQRCVPGPAGCPPFPEPGPIYPQPPTCGPNRPC